MRSAGGYSHQQLDDGVPQRLEVDEEHRYQVAQRHMKTHTHTHTRHGHWRDRHGGGSTAGLNSTVSDWQQCEYGCELSSIE